MLTATKELFTRPSGAYQISRSVRLRQSASAYFNRTPASAGNRQIFTWSAWVKMGAITGNECLFGAGTSTTTGNGVTEIGFQTDNTMALTIWQYISGTQWRITTTAIQRDPSAWYHFVIAVDTTQATSTNRIKIYINGVQQTSLFYTSYPAQNTNTGINTTDAHGIGRRPDGSNLYDGYQTEINFIDGQALTPSSFGQVNSVTGVWQPLKYTGTYGTNGFYLNFSDNSNNTATTIGKDYSGNGNNWTPNNISVTAGTTYDSMLDVPTPYADGGNGRGNYCVANPLDKGANSVAANGNLDISSNNGTRQGIKGTLGVSTGKWYFEYTKTTAASASVGVASAETAFAADSNVGSSATSWGYLTTGSKLNNNSSSAYGATWTTNDVIGVAFDMDAGTITFYKNNSSQGQAFSGLTGTVFPMGYNGSATADIFNFGQRPFAYTPPTGFKALNTQNLPTPTISNGASYMAATLYAGTSVAQSIVNTVNGVSFQPDFVWGKNRTNVNSHRLTDVNRGVGKVLFSDGTAGDTTGDGQLSSFNSNGFGLTGGAGAFEGLNQSGNNYVAWQWKAGGTAVSNTAGSITSSVSANTTAGFSVVTYTGNGTSGSTIGHGLGVAPKLILIKRRQGTNNWAVAGSILGSASTLYLNLTNAMETYTVALIGNIQTSTTFQVGNDGNRNESGGTFVAYCFAAVAGYSAFGSYTGNGSTDGPFVYLGFRPRFVLIKSTGSQDWVMLDSSTNPSNVAGNYLRPNSSGAENGGSSPTTSTNEDFLSNGIKFRNNASSSGYTNGSGVTYIYMAFAENPFKLSLAR